jgi:hypothetical protein
MAKLSPLPRPRPVVRIERHADYAQFEHKPMPEDVRREQARVERSDALMLVFPVWWWSFPAMLKGWRLAYHLGKTFLATEPA